MEKKEKDNNICMSMRMGMNWTRMRMMKEWRWWWCMVVEEEEEEEEEEVVEEEKEEEYEELDDDGKDEDMGCR